MKTKHKALLLTLCAVMLAAASVLGTAAYLTSQESVTNTFTVGAVKITLDEADVDEDSNTSDNVVLADGKVRDRANAYHLLPGMTYSKDPTVHVGADSESCWLFVKVENGISTYESADVTDPDDPSKNYKPIAGQITANGWTLLANTSDVYYKEYVKGQETKDFVVFSQFRIADNANDTSGWNSISSETTKIEVTAYAVQKDGFADAEAAWAVFSEQ